MMRNRVFFFYLLLPLLIGGNQDLNRIEEETRLIRVLLKERDYLKRVRPTQKVIVDFRLVFNQIISMVEKEQIIVTNCFVDQKWTDPRLVWNPLEFNNITWIRMSAVYVWYPDTFLYNTADNAGFLLPQDSQNVIVSYNGTVFWPLPLAQLRTRCRLTIKHFPFDEQTCDMIFGSWSHTSSLIHYRFWEKKPELPQYSPNNEWKLLAVAQSIKAVEYPNWVEPETFFEINFTILIVRKPLQAIYNTVVPALMLTTLTLVSFFIPFAQEMQIGISIMLAYSVFSLRLSDDVPSQSDSVHLISLYLTICMFFSLSAMTWFAVANKLREKKRLPYWLRWLALDYMCWMVCATSMHRKAIHNAKQQSKTPAVPPSNPVTIPLQPMVTSNAMENFNHSFSQRMFLPIATSDNSLLHPSTADVQYSQEKRIRPSVWIRRTLSNTEITTSNGSENRQMKYSFREAPQLKDSRSSKNQESLYAIHIINRFVFLMFLFIVIIINIYTWFFYSRTVQTKLFDKQTIWTCFDEAHLEVVTCNETF
ncbi:unnamed protein product [Rotaria magnacalcarata]|uniref:Uncharacterized protein n=2 Tax=Rotaria magnacalcarata TaxID=392030 RepID=A0A814GRS5_9BILA|nr:unnamed protein product [Rotaria magnacalcarata]CAF3990064.1 unnamed protein product [Rotaria magnacalcarata]